MDAQNQIHMSYLVVGTNELIYKYGDGTVWTQNTVQSGTPVAGTSLGLDSKGDPRIVVSEVGTTETTPKGPGEDRRHMDELHVDTSSIGSSIGGR